MDRLSPPPVAVTLTAAAGVLHLLAARGHVGVSTTLALALLAVGIVQVSVVVAARRWPALTAEAILLVDLAAFGAWAVSRTVGLAPYALVAGLVAVGVAADDHHERRARARRAGGRRTRLTPDRPLVAGRGPTSAVVRTGPVRLRRTPAGAHDGTDRRTDPMPDRTGGIELPAWILRTSAWTWRLLLLLIAVVLAVWLMVKLALVTLPVIVALILATLCVPVADWLERHGVKPALAALIVVVGGLLAVVGIVALLVPSFVDQILELRPTIQAGFENILDWLEEGPLGYDRQQLEDLLSQVQQRASSSGGQIASGVLTGAAAVANGIAALALMIVLLFFFVKDRAQITGWFSARTPERYRHDGSAVAGRAWGALSGYVRGTATIALIDAIGIGIGLAVLGVPLVLPLAVLVFLGAFIPVIGALLAGLVAVLVALADGGFTSALLVLGLIILVQQIEGNVLQPVIMRRAVALHPVVILIALAAGASVAGIVGAFLSVPVAAVLAAVGNELRLRQEARASDHSPEPA